MTRIFISIPWFSPAYKAGGPIQSISNLVDNFNEGVEYFIFCSNTDLGNGPLMNIETGRWTHYNEYTKVWYATTYKRSDTLLEQLKILKPDFLYIIGMYDWYFNIVPLVFSNHPNKILSVRGMLHPGALTEKALKKNLFISAWKLLGLQKKILFHATDEAEQKYTRDVFGKQVRVKIAGNYPKLFTAKDQWTKIPGTLKLLSIALISPMKNHLAVLEALKNCSGNIHYEIYGPVKDPLYWQQCCLAIEKLPANIRVTYHGDANPSLVGSLLCAADVFILPSRSENFGHAIVEALSAGLPVITSTSTPWNGLQEANAGINITPGKEELADAIQFFVSMDAGALETFSRGAAAYARVHIKPELLHKQYQNLFEA